MQVNVGIRVTGGAHGAEVRSNTLEPKGTNTIGGCGYKTGIRVDDGSDAFVGYNTLNDFRQSGIVVTGGGTTATLRRNSIRYRHFHEATLASPAGIGILVSGGASAALDRNALTGGPSAGRTTPVLATGIELRNAAPGTTVADSLVKYAQTGLRIGSPNAQVTHNTVLKSRGDGMVIDAAGGDVGRNVVTNAAGRGIVVTSSSSGLNVHDGDFQGNDGTDCVDHSAGGGTAGTANTWTGNVGDESDPDGLCAVPVPNHAPDVTGATVSIPEDSANGALVANPTFTDSDPGQSHVWSITGGNAGGAFGIDPTTGAITVADHTALDFETRPTYALTVRVTDDGTPAKHGEATVTVNLTDVNEPPVVHPATFGIFEDAANGDVVGHVTFTDPDAGQTGTYSIEAGNTGSAFAIGASNGNITVADHTQLNATTTPQYSLTVRVTDNGSPQLFGEATITIDVSHPNQPPVVDPASFTIPEGSANGTVVGTVTSTDPDAGQTLTYSIEAGNSGGAFGIDPRAVPSP